MNFIRQLLGTWIAVCLLASGAGATWPEKPIKLIVPYPPGGLTDAVARQVGAALAERLKQPVVIENIAGGGGNIGADRAARSGETLARQPFAGRVEGVPGKYRSNAPSAR